MCDLDTPFVFSSWLRSYKASRDTRVAPQVYFHEHHKVIEAILASPSVSVTVAVSTEDPNTILGWAAMDSSKGVLHYVYVKEAFRRWGVATELVGTLNINSYSHTTKYGERALGSYPCIYNPYLIKGT